MSNVPLPTTTVVDWDTTYRLIPSRYPPVDLFERIADPSEWEIIAAIEGLTNDRLRDEVGDISLVPVDQRVSGAGASPIMAAFTRVGFPTRFSDGTYGVYYASDSLEAAIREAAHHQARFLDRTAEPRARLELRNYAGSICCEMHDVRGARPEVHDPDSYAAAQRLGEAVREAGGNGVVFDSVRLRGAENVAVFRPNVLASRTGKAHVVQGPHLVMEWDGARMTRYIIVGETEWQPLVPD